MPRGSCRAGAVRVAERLRDAEGAQGCREGEPFRASRVLTVMRPLPTYARAVRTLKPGDHRFTELLPGIGRSPALLRIAPDPKLRASLLESARVLVCGHRGFAFVDVEIPSIVLSEWHYANGSQLDLYLDLVHELTHLRQLTEGFDLWDDRFSYVDRPTEVEAYAVAVEEGRRLGMSEALVLDHLSNPWMSKAEVARLLGHVDAFLGGGPLPNLREARVGAPFLVRHPWRCPRRKAR